jgi:Kef-type K+ transport system membrane component KefB
MIDSLFVEIAAVIVLAGAASLVADFLRQPLIIAYIITGLIVGPSILGISTHPELLQALSEVGIAFLLFLVGLHLNWRSVKDVGKISVLAGMGQVIFTSLIGYLFAIQFGFSSMEALFLGVGFAFSSTIIIVKLLSDKEDLERFYGRISVGILIVQDIAAMIVLVLIGAVRDQSGGGLDQVLLEAGLKILIVIGLLFLLNRYVLPKLFQYAARSQELLFLTAIAWCFALASLLYLLGFGIEIGALLAGLTLASSEFQREIDSKIRPLRDFFLILFFIVLGTNLSIDSIGSALVPGVLFSLFVLIGNPLIVIIILRAFGYHPRTGFLVGVTMAQISEFSFIVLAGGIAAGLIDESVLPLATVVALITITASTYMIKYNHAMYQRMEFLFKWLENGRERQGSRKKKAPDTIVFGYHRIGEALLETVQSMKGEYLYADFDPAVIQKLGEMDIPHIYGDAGNEDFLQYLRVERSKLVISTIPDMAVNHDILEYLTMRKFKGTVIVTAKRTQEAGELYALGADYVIVPNVLSGVLFADLLKSKKNRKSSWGVVARRDKKIIGI